MKKIRFKVWFEKEGRMLHFSNPCFCAEYDTLTFNLEDKDKTKEYQHLAGKSYIPNSKGIVFGVEINTKKVLLLE